MSFLFGLPPARQRQWGIIPPIPPNSQAGGMTGSFASVNLSRAEASLQKVAVWSCVSLIRTLAEIMPIQCFIGQDQDKRQVDLPRYLDDLEGAGFGTPDWCSQVVYSGMLRGNMVGVVADRADNGSPTQIIPQHPDAVSVRRNLDTSTNPGKPEWRVNGKIVPTSDIWHKRTNSVPGEITGLSPISMHALTIGTGIAAMRFGAQWFEDGATPSGVLTYEKDLDNGKAETAKRRFVNALRGKREPVVLGHGWTYQAIQIAPNESQFLETNNYTGAECCRIFGPAFAEVFGYETGGTLTYANIEQRSLDLLTYAADPWLVRLERMLSALCSSQRYIKFNRAALLRSDLLTRYQAHQIALQNQFMTPNEVREIEDMAPIAGGNKVITPKPAPITAKADPNP